MSRLAKILRGIAATVLTLSCMLYFGACLVGLWRTRHGEVDFESVQAASMGLTGIIIAGIFGVLAWLARLWAERPRPLIRLSPREKPPGYNLAVVGWFLGGPERRRRTPEFTDAFRTRARQARRVDPKAYAEGRAPPALGRPLLHKQERDE